MSIEYSIKSNTRFGIHTTHRAKKKRQCTRNRALTACCYRRHLRRRCRCCSLILWNHECDQLIRSLSLSDEMLINFLLFCRALRFQSHHEKEKERVPEYWKLALFFRFIPILFDGTASARARSHSFTNTPWTHLEIFFINRFLSSLGSLFFTHPIWLCRALRTITTGPITWISLDSWISSDHFNLCIFLRFQLFLP